MPKPKSPFPPWAEELRTRYLAGEAVIFILHSNVHDLAPLGDEYVLLREFLVKGLFKDKKDIVAFFDASQGFTFTDEAMATRFRRAIEAHRTIHGRESPVPVLPKQSEAALALLEEFLLIPGQRGAAVIDFVETIVPAGPLSYMNSADRANLVALQRWATEPRLIRSDSLVILITENLADVNDRVVNSPHVCPIRIPLPDEKERKTFISHLAKQYPGVKLRMSRTALAAATAGLTRIQISALFQEAHQRSARINFALVRSRKKTIIENECAGLVEFVAPEHGLDAVGGMATLKQALKRIAADIRAGRRARAPMGLLFVGPMGTGKTFVAEAFASDSGLTCLKLANFRDKWVGSTEANLEKIINVIDAMGYVLVIIDEGDRSIGGGGELDGGVNSRVMARLKEYMSDTSHRGRVLFVMMTNRPDKLDADMKRPGRFDRKLPFFFPQTGEERLEILKVLFRKNGIRRRVKDFSAAIAATDGYSGADLEAIVLLAADFAANDGRKLVKEEDLEAAIRDFIPSRDTDMLTYMELLAVFECSSRRMLPPQYARMSTEELNERLRHQRALIGS